MSDADVDRWVRVISILLDAAEDSGADDDADTTNGPAPAHDSPRR